MDACERHFRSQLPTRARAGPVRIGEESYAITYHDNDNSGSMNAYDTFTVVCSQPLTLQTTYVMALNHISTGVTILQVACEN